MRVIVIGILRTIRIRIITIQRRRILRVIARRIVRIVAGGGPYTLHSSLVSSAHAGL